MNVAALDQRFFRGKTHKIHAIDCVEVLLDLPFDLCLKKSFRLADLRFDPDTLTEDEYGRAQHALVVLLGGKKVIVEPDVALRDQWGSRHNLTARIYLAERVHGNPIGMTQGVTEDTVLDVSPFFTSLAAHGFDLREVKRALNGNKGGRRVG